MSATKFPTDAHEAAFANTEQFGLTKREYFAAMAINGYISAGNQGMPEPETLADYAVKAADALIEQLNK